MLRLDYGSTLDHRCVIVPVTSLYMSKWPSAGIPGPSKLFSHENTCRNSDWKCCLKAVYDAASMPHVLSMSRFPTMPWICIISVYI